MGINIKVVDEASEITKEQLEIMRARSIKIGPDSNSFNALHKFIEQEKQRRSIALNYTPKKQKTNKYKPNECSNSGAAKRRLKAIQRRQNNA